MNFVVQFLDDSATIIAEWDADASDAEGAISVIEGMEWPAGADRMRILDSKGREVHRRLRQEQPQARRKN